MEILKKCGIQLPFLFYLMSLFSPGCFSDFLFLTGFKEFGYDLPQIWGFFPLCFLYLDPLVFLDLWDYSFHQIWKYFGHDFFKYICLFCQPQSPVSPLLWGLQLYVRSAVSRCPVVY